MADELIEKARTYLEGEIDFEGQKLADLLSNVLLSLVGIVAFIVGYIQQDIYKTLFIGLAGTLVTFVVIVPPWPFFNTKPLTWLPAQRASRSGPGAVNIEVDGKKVS